MKIASTEFHFSNQITEHPNECDLVISDINGIPFNHISEIATHTHIYTEQSETNGFPYENEVLNVKGLIEFVGKNCDWIKFLIRNFFSFFYMTPSTFY